MALITSVEVESFRCFRELRVDGLARVNLIVGANNSGKTVLDNPTNDKWPAVSAARLCTFFNSRAITCTKIARPAPARAPEERRGLLLHALTA